MILTLQSSSPTPSRTLSRWKIALLAGLVLSTAFIASLFFLAREPDFEIRFDRAISAHVPAKQLASAIDHVSNWPNWHSWLKRAEVIDRTGTPYPLADQTL